MRAFRQAAVLCPYHPMSYLNAARTLHQLGCEGEASSHFQRALALDGGLSMVYVDIAQAQITSGNYDIGKRLLRRWVVRLILD